MPRQKFSPEELSQEVWKSVPGWEGLYSVSSLGRVKRDVPAPQSSPTGLRKVQLHSAVIRGKKQTPYARITLIEGPRKERRFIHSLVAEAFIGPCPPGKEPNHKDGNKLNNRAENIEYVSRSENIRHAFQTGLNIPAVGERQHRARATESKVLDIRRLAREGWKYKDIAEHVGLSFACVEQIIYRRTWKHL